MKVNISAENSDWLELWGILSKITTQQEISYDEEEVAYLWIVRIMEGVSNVR